jgi:hypothetical protein
MMEPVAMILAAHVTRNHVLSARPNAPTVPAPPARERRTTVAVRTSTATVLRRLADRVEPRAAESCQPAVS